MKFVKIAAVASVAAMVAGGAFANDKVAAAVTAIEGAYSSFGGSITTEAQSDIAVLLQKADNQGAVSNIDFDGLSRNEDGMIELGGLTIETHDFSAAGDGTFAIAITDLNAQITQDIYGTGNDDTTWAVTKGSDGWAASGIAGQAEAKLDAFAVMLNEVETAAGVTNWTADNIATLNSEVADVVAEAGSINTASTTTAGALAEGWSNDLAYAARTSAAADVSVVDALGNSSVVRTENEDLTVYSDLSTGS